MSMIKTTSSRNPLRMMKEAWENDDFRINFLRRASNMFAFLMLASIVIGVTFAFVTRDEWVFVGTFVTAATCYFIGYFLVPFEIRWAEANDEVG